jgi:hypothetical protein
MKKTIPALPVRDVGAAVAYYRDRFGFEAPYVADDFAILARDEAVLHLWGAADEQWPSREDLSARPVCSGAESFLAGTASCRIEVVGVESLFGELAPRGVLHDGSHGEVESTDWGDTPVRNRRPGRQPARLLPAGAGLVRVRPRVTALAI